MRAQRGFSLIEIVLTIVVVAVAVAGVASMFIQGTGHSHEPYLRQRALAVANAYMDEIINKRWNESTPIGGGCVTTGSGYCAAGPAAAGIGADEGSRAAYDDIDDYHGITAQSPPQDSSGSAMPGYNGFSVTVTVAQPGSAWNGISAQDVRLITVAVATPDGQTLTLRAYRVNL